jgi:imidazolonepropionase
MSGTPYDGGGIASTVRATREAEDATLRHLVSRRVAEMRAQGTATVEIKSGYGLTVEQEARALPIAQAFTDEVAFLGAHVVPPGIDRGDSARGAAHQDLGASVRRRCDAPSRGRR